MRAPVLTLVALLAVGCASAASRHETLGDRAYTQRRFGEALVEYRLSLAQGTVDPDLRAKAGSAALHAGDLQSAAEEFVELARTTDGARATQAADGLERVASAALTAADQQGLLAALRGLREVAPNRSLGRFAGALASDLGQGPASQDALDVLIVAAAAAGDVNRQDSTLYVYATMLHDLGRCPEAVPVLESVLRRLRTANVERDARAMLGRCALRLGERARDSDQPLTAERWFELAARSGHPRFGPRGYVGLGDVLLARGDFLGARAAYESAMRGLPADDPIAREAASRLSILDRAGSGIP